MLWWLVGSLDSVMLVNFMQTRGLCVWFNAHAIHTQGAIPLYQSDRVTQLTAGTGSIWLDDLNCAGNETQLFRCPSPTAVGVHNCGHTEDVGVRCQPQNFRGMADNSAMHGGMTCHEEMIYMIN